MTEDEAAFKWCPHVRRWDGSTGESHNRIGSNANPGGCHCIGSKCMAWRWIQDELVAFAAGTKTVVSEGKHGYCGLAGKL